MTKVILSVDEMSCQGCVRAVSNTISRTTDGSGDQVDVDLETGRATFDTEDTQSVPTVIEALEEAGFPARVLSK